MEFIKRNTTLISIIVLVGMVLFLSLLRSIERDLYRSGECTKMQTSRLIENNIQPIDYDRIGKISNAQDQIKSIIEEASTWPCLAHGHWFRIGFDPFHKDIILNDNTLLPYKEKKETVWIYIQHEFKDLNATPTGIEVVVSFNGRPERILIPYEAITWFDDPTYNFLLKPWADE